MKHSVNPDVGRFFLATFYTKNDFVKIFSRVLIKSQLFSNVYHWFLP